VSRPRLSSPRISRSRSVLALRSPLPSSDALRPACPFAFAICADFCAIELLFAAPLLVPVVLSGLFAGACAAFAALFCTLLGQIYPHSKAAGLSVQINWLLCSAYRDPGAQHDEAAQHDLENRLRKGVSM
jgi:hypothetical protein